MKKIDFPHDKASWDRFRAFYTCCDKFEGNFYRQPSYNNPPLYLFDTGELICTHSQPDPNWRGVYNSVGVTLTTTKDTKLRLPDGVTDVLTAWLDDGGMQYLLIDHDSGHAVRLDTGFRYINSHTPLPLTPGIPERFQFNCYAYIGGPGMKPISHGQIKVSVPVSKAGYTKEQLEHIHMILATGRATMKLTDHFATKCSGYGLKPLDADMLLKCKTWDDAPAAVLPAFFCGKEPRSTRGYDYLLSAEHGK